MCHTAYRSVEALSQQFSNVSQKSICQIIGLADDNCHSKPDLLTQRKSQDQFLGLLPKHLTNCGVCGLLEYNFSRLDALVVSQTTNAKQSRVYTNSQPHSKLTYRCMKDFTLGSYLLYPIQLKAGC